MAEPKVGVPIVQRTQSGGLLVVKTFDEQGNARQELLTPAQVEARGGIVTPAPDITYDPQQGQFVQAGERLTESGIKIKDYGDYLSAIQKAGYKFTGKLTPEQEQIRASILMKQEREAKPTVPVIEKKKEITIKPFASRYGLSEKAYQDTIFRFKDNPYSREFIDLSADRRAELAREANISLEPERERRETTAEVGRQRREIERITAKEARDIKEADSRGYEILQREGIDAYNAYVRQVNENSQAEIRQFETDLTAYRSAESKAKNYTIDGGYDIISIIKDKAMSKDELAVFFGENEADRAVNEARQYTGRIYDYENKRFVWATQDEIDNRERYYNTNTLVGPPGTPGKITPAEFEARREDAENWIKQYEIEPGLTVSGQTETNWIAAGQDKEADKHLIYLLLDKNAVNEVKESAEAARKLQDYAKQDGYDIAEYLRKSENDTGPLKKIGFSDEDINAAQRFNRDNYGIGAPDYQDRKEFIAQYFSDKGWGKMPYTGLIAEGAVSSDPKIQARMDEANKVFNETYRPGINATEFAKKYFADKGWEYNRSALIRAGVNDEETQKVLAEYDQRLREAMELYTKKYGTAAVVGTGIGKLGYIVPAARAINPDVKIQEISGSEWAVSAAIPALLVSGGIGSAVLRTAVSLAAGGAFTYHLADNWESMTPGERALNIGITVLIFAPYLKALAGQVKNLAVGSKGIGTGEFLANEARLSNMRKNVSKYYGQDAVNKLDDVYRYQTDLLNTVKQQDALATKALNKAQSIKRALEAEQRALSRTPQWDRNYQIIKDNIERLQSQALKAKNNYDVIIDTAPEKIKAVETKLGDKWDEFVNLNKNRPGFDSPLAREIYDRRSIVEYTRNLADELVRRNPSGLNITQLKSNLSRINKELADLRTKYPTDPSKWVGKLKEQIEAEAQLLAYQAGDAQAIGKALTKARKAVADEKRWLSRTNPKAESYSEYLLNLRKARVKILEGKYNRALRSSKIEAESARGGTGKGGTKTMLRPPPTRTSVFRTATGKQVKLGVSPKGGGASARAATAATAGLLVDAISKQALADIDKPTPMELDVARIRRIAENTGIPAITENPSVRRVIEEEYIKAIESAKAKGISNEQGLKPVIDISAINKALAESSIEPGGEPAPEPQPQPEPAPKPQSTKTPAPVKPVTPKPPLRPRILIPPSPTASDKEKRDYINKAEGVIARRRGSLGGKDVWLVRTYPYRPQDKLVILGAAPEGAKVIRGAGSTDATAVVLRGKAPTKTLFSDTGAVDDFIIPTQTRKLRIRSVRDTSNRRPLARQPARKSPSVKVGNQYFTKIGRSTVVSRKRL